MTEYKVIITLLVVEIILHSIELVFDFFTYYI